MEKELPIINYDTFDRKSYRKRIRKLFEQYKMKLRFLKIDKHLKDYNENVFDITSILFDTLNKPITYELGNIYFLIGLMDTHFDFYSIVSKRVLTFNSKTDKYAIEMLHSGIITKNKELLDVLKNNEKEPVTSDQLKDFLKGV